MRFVGGSERGRTLEWYRQKQSQCLSICTNSFYFLINIMAEEEAPSGPVESPILGDDVLEARKVRTGLS